MELPQVAPGRFGVNLGPPDLNAFGMSQFECDQFDRPGQTGGVEVDRPRAVGGSARAHGKSQSHTVYTLYTTNGTAIGLPISSGGARGVNGAAVLWHRWSMMECLGYVSIKKRLRCGLRVLGQLKVS